MKTTENRPCVDPRRVYFISEACKKLGIGRTTMWRLRKKGELKFKVNEKVGKLCISGSEILKYWSSIRA